MNSLYLITGPAGVGKSTISKKLATTKEKSVLIEGDEIYHQVIGSYQSPWKEGNHLDVFWKVCIETIKIYLNNGYNVIFNYIINKEDLERIKKEIGIGYDIKFVCLLTSEETLLKRDSERPEDCQMKDRCLVLLNEFKMQNFEVNNILYTDNFSVSETVEEIEKNIKFILKNK